MKIEYLEKKGKEVIRDEYYGAVAVSFKKASLW